MRGRKQHRGVLRRLSAVSSLLAAWLWCLPVMSQTLPVNRFELPVQSEGGLRFYLDVCQFAGEEGKTALELAYSLDLRQLLSAEAAPDSIRFDLTLQFFDTRSRLLNELQERKALKYEAAGDGNLSFIDLKRFQIAADTLQIRLQIRSIAPVREGEVRTVIMMREFAGDVSLSDLLFLSHIRRAEAHTGSLVRHGLVMVPKPSRLFPVSGEVPVYVEINRLSYDPGVPSVYALHWNVTDLAGREQWRKDYPTLPVNSANTSRVEKVPLQDLSTGVYALNLQVEDLKSQTQHTIRRYFRLYGDENDGMILPMSGKDIDKYYDQIKYIASETEKQLFKTLNPQGKQDFLLQFWKSRDPDPATPENEFMEAYFARIHYCETNFKNGINSDRGRIYLLYGPPMDIRRYASSGGYDKPVEIWTYPIEGTSEFVFVDRLGGDQYVLVHSTHPDEFSDPDWEKTLRRSE